MPNTLGLHHLHCLHRVHLLTCWGLFAALSLGACGGGSCGGGGSGTAPLTITAASPPAGTTGAAFPGYSFQASGGTPPFIWNESGPLPPGLMLSASGQLSGMPATAGTYPVSVTVTDSSYPPVTATAAVTLTVNLTVNSTDDQRGGATHRDSGFDVCAISVHSQRRPRAASLGWRLHC